MLFEDSLVRLEIHWSYGWRDRISSLSVFKDVFFLRKTFVRLSKQNCCIALLLFGKVLQWLENLLTVVSCQTVIDVSTAVIYKLFSCILRHIFDLPVLLYIPISASGSDGLHRRHKVYQAWHMIFCFVSHQESPWRFRHKSRPVLNVDISKTWSLHIFLECWRPFGIASLREYDPPVIVLNSVWALPWPSPWWFMGH